MTKSKKKPPKFIDQDSWISWKYPQAQDMDWREKDELMVKDLGMSWAHASGALKKCWIGFHTSNRKGHDDKVEEYMKKIVKIQKGMGIPVTDFGIEEEEEEDEEKELMREESEEEALRREEEEEERLLKEEEEEEEEENDG